ncbi:MAG: toll/interleukin-1 receptor domain-containing protein, partial [Clostridia bacterium]|nr:toll/interleukin-1 receptor domain-containing protein [Clostridia bacterium]
MRDARVKEQRKNGGLFISYRSESVVDAFRLFTRLTDDGYKVWLDTERLEEGVEYENKIFEAMDLSRAIITLIDANMLKAFETNPEEEHKRFYYEKEWLHAQQLKENLGDKYAILPITLHGCKRDSRIELLPSFLKKSHMCDADT